MRKTRLFTPGPTPLIPEAQLAMARSMIHHRTPEFQEILKKARGGLAKVFSTAGEVLILSSSGTGAMEAAVASFHRPGDQVVAVVAGKFGERWAELATSFGLHCLPLYKDYGETASAAEIIEVIRSQPGVKSLLIQGCETSTAAAHDLETIGKAVSSEFPDVLIIVDGITTVGCQLVRPDEWGLDVVICGSQKAFGLPPGLSFVSLSQKAAHLLEGSPAGSCYYYDLRRELSNQRAGSTSFTPASSLIVSLNEALQVMLREGLDEIIAGAELMARATRQGLQSLGFRLLSSSPANALTAVFPPPGIEADQLKSVLETDYGIKVAGGQGKLKGKIIRIAHLGYFDPLDVIAVLSAIEMILWRRGLLTELGKGVLPAMGVIALPEEPPQVV